MIKADFYYKQNLSKIKHEGSLDINPRPKYADGTPAHSKFITQVFEEYDISKGEFPITTLRNTAIKTGIKEIMVIYQDQVNTKEGFHKNKVMWWDEWMNEQDNIGRAYSHNLESHRPNETVREIVKIEPIIINTEYSSIKDVGLIYPIEKSIDGKVYLDSYIVVSESDKTDSKNRKFFTIQFLDSGYKTTIRKDKIGISGGKNVYRRTNYNIGYLGEYGNVKNIDTSIVDILMDKWENMLRRCYSQTYQFKNMYKDVFVHQDWHCFETFLNDIRMIPQYHLAKEDNFQGWELDKDYYGSNCYSKETCVFLTKKDNMLYRKSYSIKVTNEKLKVNELIIDLTEYCNENNLNQSKANLVVNGNQKTHKGYKFDKILDNNLYRYELSRNQINILLYNLKNNPFSRRHMTNFWNWSNIDKKELVECAYGTHWSVRYIDGEYYLDLTLIQRSNDYLTAGYINKIQYVALQMMIAGHLKYKVGKFCHLVQNLHVYDRHFDALDEILDRPTLDIQPKIELKESKNFYDYLLEDFTFMDTKIPKIKSNLELAI